MKIQQIFALKITAICLALSLVAALIFLPAVASAVTGQQVDVCGSGAACNRFVENYLNPAIVALTSLVGITAVISIVLAGIQYSTSADDPGAVTKAKQRIFNVVLGLVAYIFLLAFLYYLVPGGLF